MLRPASGESGLLLELGLFQAEFPYLKIVLERRDLLIGFQPDARRRNAGLLVRYLRLLQYTGVFPLADGFGDPGIDGFERRDGERHHFDAEQVCALADTILQVGADLLRGELFDFVKLGVALDVAQEQRLKLPGGSGDRVAGPAPHAHEHREVVHRCADGDGKFHAYVEIPFRGSVDGLGKRMRRLRHRRAEMPRIDPASANEDPLPRFRQDDLVRLAETVFKECERDDKDNDDKDCFHCILLQGLPPRAGVVCLVSLEKGASRGE